MSALILCAIIVADDQAQSPATPPVSPHVQTLASPDFSKPRPHFPDPITPYEVRAVEPPVLVSSPRLSNLIHDGKLMLSLNDAIALTLENNLDIAISRYNLDIADTDVLRTSAGANSLGVNAGVVQNTPGGGVGGLSGTVGSGTGGTSVGSAGVGTGTNGLVSSTLGIGSLIPSFDPILNGTLQMDRNHSLGTNFQSGVPVINTNTGTADFGYQQGFHWGTTGSVTFNNSHVTSNNTTPLLSPSVSSNFQVKITQPLLQGFGQLPNTRYIVIAGHNRQITDAAFRLQIITTVDQIENLYWNLVYASENVRVDEVALAYAQKILTDDRTAVRYGTMQPIQIVNAESTVAGDQQALTLARTNLQLQQLLMKNAISRVYSDSFLRDAEVIPTSTMQMPDQEPASPTEDLVKEALRRRTELAESRIDLGTREVNTLAVANALLPVVDASAYYGGSGLGGDINPKLPLCSTTVLKRCFNPATGPPPFRNGGPVSYGSALNQMVDSTAPDKGVAVTLTATIRNREAQANQIRSELELRQAQVRLQQLENQIAIEVRNAQFDVQQNRASVQAAQSAVDFAGKTLYAAERQLQVGVGTPDAVLQGQSVLVSAQGNLLSALAAYEESHVELDRATGLLLDHAGILMDDALHGRVTQMPNVPDIVPAQVPAPQPEVHP